jgi:hypothetical protein
MRQFLTGALLLLGAMACPTPSSEVPTPEPAVLLQVDNQGFTDAVVYVLPCGQPSCAQRLGDVVGITSRRFQFPHSRLHIEELVLHVHFRAQGDMTLPPIAWMPSSRVHLVLAPRAAASYVSLDPM